MIKYCLSLIVAYASFSSLPAFAWDCDTNCEAETSACTRVFGRNVCTPPEPTSYSSCLSVKATDCSAREAKKAAEIFEPYKQWVVDNMALAIANDENVKSQSGGWDKDSCTRVAGGTIVAVSMVYGAGICSLVGVSTAGTGVTPCTIFLGSAGAVLTTATCTQLCHDHQLRDCK